MARKLRIFCAVLIILVGLAVFAYPTLSQKYIEWKGMQALAEIDQLRSTQPTVPETTAGAEEPAATEETVEIAETAETTEATEPTLSSMELLKQELVAYNEQIYREGQANFKDPFSYETPPIDLTEYGFEENVIATIWIPRLELELPVYLGATKDNLAKGAAVLGETSLPVSGENTNVAIAAHRGWRGAPMFRDIQLIQIDDKITITTPWETLIYRVCELEIITPSDINAVMIQPGRQLLTLMTCHPYTQNYQRYLVRAELSEQEQEQTREEDLSEAERTFDETARTVNSTDESGNVRQIQVEPVSIQPVPEEGTEQQMSGDAYSNTVILLEKYAPPVMVGLLVLLLLVRLINKRRKERG